MLGTVTINRLVMVRDLKQRMRAPNTLSSARGNVAHVDVVRTGATCPWSTNLTDDRRVLRRGAILLLHGITCFGERWAPQFINALCKIGLDVLIPTYGDRCSSIRGIAQALRTEVGRLVDRRSTRIIVLGHSMGGMIA